MRDTALPIGPKQSVPDAWRQDLAGILLTEAQIAHRVRELAAAIERDFQARDTVVVAVLNGTLVFLADLIRHLNLRLRIDSVGVSSYRDGTTSGDLVFTKPPGLDLRGRDVLVVDDILDTGKTLDRVVTHLRRFKPRRLRTCVLLDKRARRQVKIHGDYTGFVVPDVFVVGYGLDFAERYRNLPFIGVLEPEIYQSNPATPATTASRARPKASDRSRQPRPTTPS